MVNNPFEKFRFTWAIEHFSSCKKKQYSEIFTVGGYKWRLLIFPKGQGVDQLSLFLDVADSARLPSGWSVYADFTLAIVNQIQPKLARKKAIVHTFNDKESDWGFKSFMPLCDVHDHGYIIDDTLIVEAEFNFVRGNDYRTHDSRKQTEQSETRSPPQSSESAGKSEDLSERPGQCKRAEGTCKEESLISQHKEVVSEAPGGVIGEVMTIEQIANVLGDITRGLVPTDLEDPRWPSSAGGMTAIFAPVVRLTDEFRTLKGEVERLRTKEATLIEVVRLLGQGEGGAGPFVRLLGQGEGGAGP